MFFSEEKNQETFAFDAIPFVFAVTSTLPQAQAWKSFGSFLQNRTASFYKLLSLFDFFSGRPGEHFQPDWNRRTSADEFPVRLKPLQSAITNIVRPFDAAIVRSMASVDRREIAIINLE
jgi:hypothetical protein